MMKYPVNIDVVILSYAADDALRKLTEQTIATLRSSERPEDVEFYIYVIESNRSMAPFQFEHSVTIYPESPFGFNQYLNIGIKASTNNYVCLCNNDLIFHDRWATEILAVMRENPHIRSANPFCDAFHYSVPVSLTQKMITGTASNFFKGILTGWCIFVKREIFEVIGLLDESFNFWYADRDYGRTLLKFKIGHALVCKSVVTHLGNRSHGTLHDSKLEEFTIRQRATYEKKWGKDKQPFPERLKARAVKWKNRFLLFFK